MADQNAQLRQCIDCLDDCCDHLNNDPSYRDELVKCQDLKQQLESQSQESGEGVRGIDTYLPMFLQLLTILQALLQKRNQPSVQSGSDEIQAAAERGAKGVAGPQQLKRGGNPK